MQPELISIRQDIHAHPEMAMEEVRTSTLVATKLKQWGITVTEGIGRMGVIGTLKSLQPGDRTIGLRADMDALQLTEQTDVPYISTKPGTMHACGHDGHTTMLLGAAKYLAEHRDSFCGTVHFIFQPAEEGQKGAIAMINDKMFDRFPMDAIYGIHNYPDPLGKFTIRFGPMFAASDRWYVTFHGSGGHGGATPHLATDVTVLLAQFILALQTIVSRNVSAIDSAVISVGAIERRIKELVHGLATSFGCTAEVEYVRLGTPLVNHEEQTKRAIKAAKAVVGAENVDKNRVPSMGGEDFAFMVLERPGAFIFLGINDEAHTAQLHSPTYNFNDKAIPFGVAYWITLVQQELNE
ncbi:unnamed protein product [Rotaria sordida]|uniref:Amidohydrolase n=1 Tax=Rotaria sordida TaxID=392033 RepID=A0A819H5M5_9BILA|nr:unnamed protein product [Rotaria sordida]